MRIADDPCEVKRRCAQLGGRSASRASHLLVARGGVRARRVLGNGPARGAAGSRGDVPDLRRSGRGRVAGGELRKLDGQRIGDAAGGERVSMSLSNWLRIDISRDAADVVVRLATNEGGSLTAKISRAGALTLGAVLERAARDLRGEDAYTATLTRRETK